MSESLLHVTRGNCVENIHRGDIAVVDHQGHLAAWLGDPQKRTFMRSCAKPIQALAVIETGAAEAYGITDRELAVMCASHYAEPFHVEAVRSVLEKLGLSEEHLLCGASYSLNEEVLQRMCLAGEPKRRIYNNCSGKHAGMLAVVRRMGLSLDAYDQAEHPLQQLTLKTLSEVCEVPAGEIGLGIDGCGVPVVALPLYNMALSFAKLAHSSVFPPLRQRAADAVTAAMRMHPEMVAGTGGFCTELMRLSHGKLFAKLGADAVYCIGVPERGIGIAVKVEDGNMKVLSSAVMETLKQLEVLGPQELEALKHFHFKENINSLGQQVGMVQPVFRLETGRFDD